MKRLALFLAILLVPLMAFASTPYDNSENSFVYFGTITLANDTIWYPGIKVEDGWPAMRGIPLDGYKYLGYEFQLLQVDTTLIDSIHVDLYTGYIGGVVDSMTLIIPADSILNGVFADAAASDASAKKWIGLIDTSFTPVPYWFQRYVWWGIRAVCGVSSAEGDTITSGVPDSDVNPDSTTEGDGFHDWFATNGNDSWETEIDGAFDSTSYLLALDTDSSVIMYETPAPVAVSPGTFDSVVYIVRASTDVVVDTACSLRLALGTGDTLSIDTSLITWVWSASQALADWTTLPREDSSALYYRFKFTTDPYGRAWERSWLEYDSVMVRLIASHCDGTTGQIKVYTMADTLYSARTDFYPVYKYRLGIWLKK